MRKVTYSVALAAATALVIAGIATAAHYTLFGNASIVASGNPGNAAQLVSSLTGTPAYAGVDVSPTSPIAWSSLATLSSDFNVTDDSCGGGSPRFVLDVDTTGDNVADGDVSISFGPSPSFTGCTTGWQSTGNLIGNNDAGRYDFSHLGGSPFTTYSNAPAAVQNGKVVGIAVVVDGYWNTSASGGDNEQTVLVDNVTVNDHVTTFEAVGPATADQCKKGGWQSFTSPAFKNQGDCIQFVNTGK